jgi:hypothetical protein
MDAPLFPLLLVALVARRFLLLLLHNVQSTRVKQQRGNAVVVGTVAGGCNEVHVVRRTLQLDASSVWNEQTIQMEQTCRRQCWRLKRYKAESLLRFQGNRIHRVHHVVHVHNDTTMTLIIVVVAVGLGGDLNGLLNGMVDHVCLDIDLASSANDEIQLACIVLLSVLDLYFLPNFHLLDGTIGMSLETCQIKTVAHRDMSVMKGTFTKRHPSARRCMLTSPWRSAMGMSTGTRLVVTVARLGHAVMIETSGAKHAAVAVILVVTNSSIMV